MTVTIHLFENPNIENGISFKTNNVSKKALGLLVKNYRPKLMRIPSITTKKYNKIQTHIKKSKNPFQKINIKPTNEKWLMYNDKTKTINSI